jgi:hypothetical protein
MPVLETTAYLSGLGLAGLVLGHVFGYHEIGVIGGVILLGAGGMVLEDGLQYQTGETVIKDTAFDGHVVNNTTVYNATNTTADVTREYRTISTPTRFSLGFLLMVFGGTGILREFNAFTQ